MKKLCFAPIKVSLRNYLDVGEAIEDIKKTLAENNIPTDGAFIECNSQLAYAWIYDSEGSRTMRGDEIR